MATIKVYVDTRSSDRLGQCAVRIAVGHKSKTAYIPTGIKIATKDYNEKRQMITGNNAAVKNNTLRALLLDCEQKIFDLKTQGLLPRMSALDIKQYIENGGIANNSLFIPFYKKEIEKKEAEGTRTLYRATLKHIMKFAVNADTLTFDDITVAWLRDFEQYLMPISPSANARSIIFRNIRAVINSAIDEDLTTNYPFRKFKIKQEPTRKRNLTIEQLRELYAMQLSGREEYFRDIFFLCYFLIGINLVDLWSLKKTETEKIVYKRAKTKKMIEVKIEPEAAAIIDRYAGKGDNLIDLSERYCDVRHATMNMDAVLKRLAPDLSQYWCRHSWASVAAELDIPIETVSAALGHSYGAKVTNIYINFNQKKIDEANRKVIDYLLNKC